MKSNINLIFSLIFYTLLVTEKAYSNTKCIISVVPQCANWGYTNQQMIINQNFTFASDTNKTLRSQIKLSRNENLKNLTNNGTLEIYRPSENNEIVTEPSICDQDSGYMKLKDSYIKKYSINYLLYYREINNTKYAFIVDVNKSKSDTGSIVIPTPEMITNPENISTKYPNLVAAASGTASQGELLHSLRDQLIGCDTTTGQLITEYTRKRAAQNAGVTSSNTEAVNRSEAIQCGNFYKGMGWTDEASRCRTPEGIGRYRNDLKSLQTGSPR